MKKMNKATKVTLIAVGGFLAFIFLVLAGFSIGENIVFADFYKDADKEFKIPGLWGGSVPQGFEYIEESGLYLYTGYHKDKQSPSMVYVIPRDGDGEARKIDLYEKDGSPFTSHVGGITVYGDYAYIADGKSLALFELSDILDNDNKAKQYDTIEVDFGVAFVEAIGNTLYAGNFYRAVDYETPASHHITTPNGDKNTAIIYQYELNPETSYPVSIYPNSAYSITDAIQGMTVDENGKILLSSSWGLSKSHIYIYDESQASKGEFTTPRGDVIPLTFLDSKCLEKNIVSPPMAEEIVCKDGRVYIIGESASMKYLFGKLTGGNYVYSYQYEK